MRRVANVEISDELLAEVGGIEPFVAMLPKETEVTAMRVDRMQAKTVIQVEHPAIKPVMEGAAIPYAMPTFRQNGEAVEFVGWGQDPHPAIAIKDWFK